MSLKSFIGAGLEAGDGAPVRFILRNPGGIELNETQDDLVLGTNTISNGGVSTFAVFVAEGSFTELQVDLDIGADGQVDCGTEVDVDRP